MHRVFSPTCYQNSFFPDTEDLYTEVYKGICAEYGKHYGWDLKMKLMGKKPYAAAQEIINALELPLSPEEWIERIKHGMEPLFPQAKLLPGKTYWFEASLSLSNYLKHFQLTGVMKLVQHLKRKNVPIAICTGDISCSFHG